MTAYDNIMRTIIDLPKQQLNALPRLCEAQKISRAEAIRRAVDRLLKDDLSGTEDAWFGMWRHKSMNARAYLETVRNEWGSV